MNNFLIILEIRTMENMLNLNTSSDKYYVYCTQKNKKIDLLIFKRFFSYYQYFNLYVHSFTNFPMFRF